MNQTDVRLDQLDTQTLAGEASLLASLGAEFAASAEIGPTLKHAVTRIMEYMDAEAASIFLCDDGRLVCRACAGPIDITGFALDRGHGIVGRAVEGNALQQVHDVRGDQGFSDSVDTQTGFVTRSILCAPLAIKGEVLGAIEVINKHSRSGLFQPRDGHLLMALASLAVLSIHNARMAEALVEQERIRRELELAREIQQSLLPARPDEGFPLHALNEPAYEVSGDFYDWQVLPDGRIGFSLGDVSGKGMRASLLMAKTASLLRCLGKETYSPGALLARVNEEIVETASHGMFVTVVTGVFDPPSGRVVFANGGHPPPLLQRDSQFVDAGDAGPPLGVLAGAGFPETELVLKDEALYIYTDGATEAGLEEGMLERAGLVRLLARHSFLKPAIRLTATLSAIRAAGKIRDDVTMMLVQGG